VQTGVITSNKKIKIMKDIIFYLLIYKIFNTPFHNEHSTLIAVCLTLWICVNVLEIINECKKNKL